MATNKTKPPILPRNYQDPTGADALERRTMKDFARRMKKIGKAYKSALDKIPSSLAVNARYEYQLNPTLLSIILNDASYLVDQVLLEGGDYDLWFYEYIDLASEKGPGSHSTTSASSRRCTPPVVSRWPPSSQATLTSNAWRWCMPVCLRK